MIERFVGLLLTSRNIAHKDHWATTSFAEHMTLNTFYDGVLELTDSLVEMYQGRNGKLKAIPIIDEPATGKPLETLITHLKWLEDTRYSVVPKEDTAIQNQIDEIVGLYLSTIYKLRELH
jgi:hypothetical protein